jgi:hypothetical protein
METEGLIDAVFVVVFGGPLVAVPVVAADSRLLRLRIGCAGLRMAVDSVSSERAVGISLWEVFRENGEGERAVWLSLAEELRFIGLSGRLLDERDVLRCRVIAPGIFNKLENWAAFTVLFSLSRWL